MASKQGRTKGAHRASRRGEAVTGLDNVVNVDILDILDNVDNVY
jgi:hypothetical protein